jgi:hypothetical protein
MSSRVPRYINRSARPHALGSPIVDVVELSLMSKAELQAELDSTSAAMKTAYGRGRAIQARADREGRAITATEQSTLDELNATFERQERYCAQLEDQ